MTYNNHSKKVRENDERGIILNEEILSCNTQPQNWVII
jgi:hypothetical protein